ncbi:unnamed protein product [Leuciscus chuanchicus]
MSVWACVTISTGVCGHECVGMCYYQHISQTEEHTHRALHVCVLQRESKLLHSAVFHPSTTTNSKYRLEPSVCQNRLRDVRFSQNRTIADEQIHSETLSSKILKLTSRSVTDEPRLTSRSVTDEPRLTSRSITDEPRLTSRSVTDEPRLTSRSVTDEPRLTSWSVTDEPRLTSWSVTDEPRLTSRSVTDEPRLTSRSVTDEPGTVCSGWSWFHQVRLSDIGFSDLYHILSLKASSITKILSFCS